MKITCPKCGGDSQSRGKTSRGTPRFYCVTCDFWFVEKNDNYSFESKGDTAEWSFETEKRIVTEKDLIEAIELDTKVWEVERFFVGKSEGYRKDRSVVWDVQNGVVVNGKVNDTGKLLIKPLYSVKVWLRRKTKEIRTGIAIEDIKKQMSVFAPKYPKIKYPKIKDGMLLELCVFDFHYGRLCWHEESGYDYDIDIARKALRQTMGELISYAKGFNIDRILLPLGGDYFNSNSKTNSTVSGTPMQEDTRYSKTFKRGRELAIEIIDECSCVAPVDVLVVKGNHDEERIFYLGDSLECWYNRNPNVKIDNQPKSRKYYSYHKNLIGFTHGNDVKLEKLPMLMALEVPDLWKNSTYREIHTGDKHHRFQTKESGVVIRIIGSIVAPDQWTYDKGFVGSRRGTESFMFHSENGFVAQFSAGVREKQEKR